MIRDLRIWSEALDPTRQKIKSVVGAYKNEPNLMIYYNFERLLEKISGNVVT